METIMSILEGPNPEPVMIPSGPPPRNMPYKIQPDPEKLLELYHKQQEEIERLRKQAVRLNEHTAKLQSENAKLHEILDEAHDPVLKNCLKNIMQAIKTTPGFEERLQKRLKQLDQEPHFHVIIDTIESLLNEDIEVPQTFEKENDDWNWVLSEEKTEIRKYIKQYKEAIEMLGDKMNLTTEQVKALLTELGKMANDPTKQEETNGKLLTIARVLGKGVYGTFLMFFYIYRGTSYCRPVIRYITPLAPWPFNILFRLVGL